LEKYAADKAVDRSRGLTMGASVAADARGRATDNLIQRVAGARTPDKGSRPLSFFSQLSMCSTMCQGLGEVSNGTGA
jgi:hypothetical protein